MIKLKDIEKNVGRIKYYDMDCFKRDADYYMKAIETARLLYAEVKSLKSSKLYGIYRITNDGYAYSLHMLFIALGYRTNDNLQVYLPYNSVNVVREHHNKVLNTLFKNGFISEEQFNAVATKQVAEI